MPEMVLEFHPCAEEGELSVDMAVTMTTDTEVVELIVLEAGLVEEAFHPKELIAELVELLHEPVDKAVHDSLSDVAVTKTVLLTKTVDSHRVAVPFDSGDNDDDDAVAGETIVLFGNSADDEDSNEGATP